MARQFDEVPGTLGLQQGGSQDVLFGPADKSVQERRSTQHAYHYTFIAYIV